MKVWAKQWWPALLVAVAVVIQFRAPLLGRVYAFEDIAAYFQPLYAAAARQMRAGYLPSWELGAWSGFPLLGDPQVGALYPPNWLWLALAPLRSYAWLALAHAGFGAAGMWMVARARGRSKEAAAVAALSLGLGAFMVLQVRHAMFGATTAWLPWLWWGIDRYSATRRLEHLVATAAALGMALLAGGWSMLYFGGWVIAVIAAARILAAPSGRGRLALAVALEAAALLSAGLAAVQLGPALQHARLSPRALGVDFAFASSYAWPSWRYLLTLVVPTLYGDDARGTYTGAPDQWELCGYAVGVVATLLGACALLDKERRRERWALIGLLGVACLLARGADGPLHGLFFRFVPVYGSLRCPARALYVWTLVMPVLAADGLDALTARMRPSWRRWVPALVVVALATELLVTWRAQNPSTPLAETRVRPAAVSALLSGRESLRYTNDVHLGQRFHNSGLVWNVESAGGYSSLPLWRYLHFLWIANHGSVYPHARLAHDLTAQGLWTFSSPLVDLLGVGWVLAPRARPIVARSWRRVAEGADGVDLWRNDDAYPRAFILYRTRVAAGDDAQARALADPKFRPSRVAIVPEALPGVPEVTAGEEPPLASELVALTRTSPIDLAVEAVARAPGVLVIAEPWHPGWRATLDGKPIELLRVDYALRGVALPPGRHEVAMTFEDDPLAYGGAITVTALSALVGLTLLARRRRSLRR